MQRTKFVETCKCTEDDWECDIGYHRDLNNIENQSSCIPFKNNSQVNVHDAPETCLPGN